MTTDAWARGGGVGVCSPPPLPRQIVAMRAQQVSSVERLKSFEEEAEAIRDAIEALVGAGVFYGSSVGEAQACAGSHVFVVGGGNSAGARAGADWTGPRSGGQMPCSWRRTDTIASGNFRIALSRLTKQISFPGLPKILRKAKSIHGRIPILADMK